MVFDINLNYNDEKIIKKIYSFKYITLKGNAEWALGIVTGNNNNFLINHKKNKFEKIYKGKEITPYTLGECENYIKFEPNNFQQSAPENKYRAPEKLIYRFISDKLVFAYDNMQRLTLNSANILIPKIDDYSIKIILALFNSPLYQYLYKKKFMSIKILRSHLESLPLPLFDKKIRDNIVAKAEQIIDNKFTIKEINEYIFSIFDITIDEKKYLLEEL